MLERQNKTNVHDVSTEPRSTTPIRRFLEMYQADSGDLLRIRTPGGAIIVDTGTARQAQRLRELLAELPCRLLVITHLDADHFGGIRSLLASGADDVQWPQEIWVNEGDIREGVETVARLVDARPKAEDDRPLTHAAALGHAIAVAKEWQSKVEVEVIVAAGGEAFGDREPAAIIESDHATARYLLESEVPRLPDALIATVDFLNVLRDLLRSGWDLVRSEVRGELLEMVKDLLEGIVRAHEDLRGRLHESGWIDDRDRFVIPFDDGAIVVRAVGGPPRIRILCRDASLARDLRDDGSSLPLPPPLRGLLHLARRGPAILESLAEDAGTLTLIEALRQRSRVCDAAVGKDTSHLDELAPIEVLGPDQPELDELRRIWSRVREKGTIHRQGRHLMYLEATLFNAAYGRYYVRDRSITNRSSIQLRVSGELGSVVLTGDGLPETIERVLSQSPLPCRVFKASHHGSAHNIRIDQIPNHVFSILDPREVWVSGKGSHHPSEEFLDYLRLLREHHRFRVAVTNSNAHVRRHRRLLEIETAGPGPCVAEF